MNYRKAYENLCERGKLERGLEYYEKHHIIPKCLGGNDLPTNLSKLTAREHYIAHWLLYKMYPANWKISNAFFWMATENKKNDRKISGKQYEIAKIAMASNCAVRMKSVGNPMQQDSAKKKISESMKGDNNPMRRFPERNHILNGGKTPSMDGAKWFTDGTNSRYFKPDDTIPANWTEGMAPYLDRGKWITDGNKNRKLKDNNSMPHGFSYGKTHKKKI